MTLNGVIGGLVAITAGCDIVTPVGALAIGVIAGIVMTVGIEIVDKKFKVDDPVGAVGVHCICGVTGTLLTGVFGAYGEGTIGILYGGGFGFFGVQCLGVLSVAVWSIGCALILFKALKATVGLRVSREEEIRGLDIEEHGLESSYADFQNVDISL